jgi:hypothetical protein
LALVVLVDAHDARRGALTGRPTVIESTVTDAFIGLTAVLYFSVAQFKSVLTTPDGCHDWLVAVVRLVWKDFPAGAVHASRRERAMTNVVERHRLLS